MALRLSAKYEANVNAHPFQAFSNAVSLHINPSSNHKLTPHHRLAADSTSSSKRQWRKIGAKYDALGPLKSHSYLTR
jgi:hypothetical protein